MNYTKRAELFRQLRAKHIGCISSVLWKLTGDRELFTEALQYSLLGMWQHIEKLNSHRAGAYIYRIVLTANSKAWRDRIGKNGHFSPDKIDCEKDPVEKTGRSELAVQVRKAISRLPVKQSRAIVMRYFE
jgi:RNA polymerase sigma factor (sigma-70 family)